MLNVSIISLATSQSLSNLKVKPVIITWKLEHAIQIKRDIYLFHFAGWKIFYKFLPISLVL